MDAVNFAELNELAGELLPERTVLSTVTTPFNNWNPSNAGGGNGDGGVVVAPDHGYDSQSACNTNDSPESNGGLLGLFTSAQQNTQACTPASSSGSY